MTHQTTQDIDLWEAWIEFDHVSQNRFGTLYIMGEVLAHKKQSKPSLIKNHFREEPQTLVLQIQTSSSSAPNRIAEVVYSEIIDDINQYSAVKIYKENELLIHIEEIEVMI